MKLLYCYIVTLGIDDMNLSLRGFAPSVLDVIIHKKQFFCNFSFFILNWGKLSKRDMLLVHVFVLKALKMVLFAQIIRFTELVYLNNLKFVYRH